MFQKQIIPQSSGNKAQGINESWLPDQSSFVKNNSRQKLKFQREVCDVNSEIKQQIQNFQVKRSFVMHRYFKDLCAGISKKIF